MTLDEADIEVVMRNRGDIDSARAADEILLLRASRAHSPPAIAPPGEGVGKVREHIETAQRANVRHDVYVALEEALALLP